MEIKDKLFIDGQWCDSSDGKTMPLINPATEEKIGEIPVATDDDIERVLVSAERAWYEWREVDAWTRSKIIRKIADLIRDNIDVIAPVLTEEQGKTISEAQGELRSTADQFDWYADEARRIYGRVIDGHSREQRIMVIHQSIGPVAAFSPWNFPALLSSRKIAPALAAGCSIILKPAEEAPRTTLFLAHLCQKAGIPDGVVNMITGDPAHISKRLISSPVIRKVTITGSVPVGKEIMCQCADGLKPVSLELGGHSPVIVFPDADVEEAATICANGKYRNNGQVCISASRFYVHESVIERFTETFVRITKSLKIGNGSNPETQIGPLANKRRLDAVQQFVADALDKGANLACGGKRPEGFEKGFFFEPTVLTNVKPNMEIMREEPFCPVAPIAVFREFDEVIKAANNNPFGLAGYIFTKNTKTAFLAAEKLDVGMVGVNNLLLSTAEAPFGGIKSSGFGREGGSEGIEYYTNIKYINIKL